MNRPIQRVPIKIQRTAIKLSQRHLDMIPLWETMEKTRTEDIIEISRIYDRLRRDATNKAGFTSLPLSDPTSGKNWVVFEEIYELCRIKEWQPGFYLEAQFDRARRYGQKFKFPMTNALTSIKAIEYMMWYNGRVHLTYERDVGAEKRKRGSEALGMAEIIRRDISRDISFIHSKLHRKGEITKEDKALFIFNNWHNLSPFYLYSIRWFHEVLEAIIAKPAEPYKKEFARINSSRSMREVIDQTVREIEKLQNLPPNIIFS